MKRKGLISLGHTLFSNVINFNKKSKQPQVSLPLIYAGSWQFIDELSNRTHCLEITTDLRQVQMLTSKELIFLDGYGYHLRIDAIDGKPISVYDEADNRVYELSEKLDSDGCL